jgi:hypothetical protein
VQGFQGFFDRCVRIEAVDLVDAELDRLLEDGPASSSPKDHSLNPRDSPKLMQPSAIRLTFKPDLPRRMYSMSFFLVQA